MIKDYSLRIVLFQFENDLDKYSWGDGFVKNIIEREIREYASEYEKRHDIYSSWKEPIIAYAGADDPLFLKLREVATPTHALPRDFIEDAKTVITYFLPFEESIANSNVEGRGSSIEWGRSYIETNSLIGEINVHIKTVLEESGYTSTLIPATHNFSEKTLMSDWSQRHVAYIAGLGKFGLNRMLITEKGCCGRIGSIVTNLAIEPTERIQGESCLYKENGSCGVCARRCVNDALSKDESRFDRHKCYEMCLYNADRLKDIGYADVCGKCLVGMPCSFEDPVANIKKQ